MSPDPLAEDEIAEGTALLDENENYLTYADWKEMFPEKVPESTPPPPLGPLRIASIDPTQAYAQTYAYFCFWRDIELCWTRFQQMPHRQPPPPQYTLYSFPWPIFGTPHSIADFTYVALAEFVGYPVPRHSVMRPLQPNGNNTESGAYHHHREAYTAWRAQGEAWRWGHARGMFRLVVLPRIVESDQETACVWAVEVVRVLREVENTLPADRAIY